MHQSIMIFLVTCIFLSIVFCTKANFAFFCFAFVLFFVEEVSDGTNAGQGR